MKNNEFNPARRAHIAHSAQMQAVHRGTSQGTVCSPLVLYRHICAAHDFEFHHPGWDIRRTRWLVEIDEAGEAGFAVVAASLHGPHPAPRAINRELPYEIVERDFSAEALGETSQAIFPRSMADVAADAHPDPREVRQLVRDDH
ncbi:hypothetical protein CHELA1G11_11949 [Hyphomicrobiales bacterium]|nr:hypothetical protein CHELA1G11_11949 [Hyphomicrobiales bacterium]CAH1664334.1 hypothetical protein CHELA1G2_12361 [Hyphomicrobiales bacterium]